MNFRIYLVVIALISCRVRAQGCADDHLACSNGLCVPLSQTCDFHNDCGDRDNSDEADVLCAGRRSYSFCRQYKMGDLVGPCKQRSQLGTADSYLENGMAVFKFTAPTVLFSMTHLTGITVNSQNLIPADLPDDVTLIVNVTLQNSAQQTVQRIWVGRRASTLARDEFRVPLEIEEDQVVLVSMKYIVASSPKTSSVPVSTTSRGDVSLTYTSYYDGCGCVDLDENEVWFGVWRWAVVTSLYRFGTECGVPENNKILFNLFDHCVPSCPYEVILFGGRNLTFMESRPGNSTGSKEMCSSNKQLEDAMPLASRSCAADLNKTVYWLQPVTNNCTVNVNEELDKLKNGPVTSANVMEVVRRLVRLTNNNASIDSDAVSSTADILESVVSLQEPSPEVTSDVVRVVNNLLQIDEAKNNETSITNSSSRIVLALETQISHVLASGENFTGVESSLAVKALNVPAVGVANGVGFTAGEGTTSGKLANNSTDVFYSDLDRIDLEQAESYIHLPGVIASEFREDGTVPISFILYQNDKLFRPSLNRQAESAGSRPYIDSVVISATVLNVTLRNLPEDTPITSVFQRKQVQGRDKSMKGSVHCVFWDFGLGNWSTKGCRLVASNENRSICHCNHTTSFAVLLDVYGQKYSSPPLDIISKIGCGVSIVALVITIAIYLAIKTLRAKTASQILVSFSLSLLGLYTVFVVGIEQTSSPVPVGCVIVAVLLHYLTLTSMFWMGVEAANLYLKLVKITNSYVRHFMIKASIAAWGFPAIVVALGLAFSVKDYGNKDSCFLKPGYTFYFGLLLIIGLILLFNAIVFTRVIYQLTCKASKIQSSSSSKKKIRRRVQNAVSISVLLGLTWAFGLFSIIESSNFVFQIFFSVFNSLQGVLIFLLFVVFQEKIREAVGKLVVKRRETSSSGESTSRQVITWGKDTSSRKLEETSGVISQDASIQMKIGMEASRC